MALLHKIEVKESKNNHAAKSIMVEETWQMQPEWAHAILRLVRACFVTSTWFGISTSKKTGGVKISVRNKGVGTDDWFDTPADVHALCKEIEELVEHEALLVNFLSLPEFDAPKGYRRVRPGSVDDYELASPR